MFGMTNPKMQDTRKALQPELKQKMSFFLRHIEPVFAQALHVADQLMPQISKLEALLSNSEQNYNL